MNVIGKPIFMCRVREPRGQRGTIVPAALSLGGHACLFVSEQYLIVPFEFILLP